MDFFFLFLLTFHLLFSYFLDSIKNGTKELIHIKIVVTLWLFFFFGLRLLLVLTVESFFFFSYLEHIFLVFSSFSEKNIWIDNINITVFFLGGRRKLINYVTEELTPRHIYMCHINNFRELEKCFDYTYFL